MPRRHAAVWAAALMIFAMPLGGCLTPRQQARVDAFPRNRVFTPEDVVPLGADVSAFLGEYDSGGGQNLCILQLAPGARLGKRYHARHDLTLMVVSGKGIVEVEETRYAVGPGTAVLLPRLTAYAVLPNQSEGEFVALLVYSPAFDGEDVVLEK